VNHHESAQMCGLLLESSAKGTGGVPTWAIAGSSVCRPIPHSYIHSHPTSNRLFTSRAGRENDAVDTVRVHGDF
jgi:hypothetical protein